MLQNIQGAVSGFLSNSTFFFTNVSFVALFTVLFVVQVFLSGAPRMRLYVLLLFSLLYFFKFSGVLIFSLVATSFADYLILGQMSRARKEGTRRGLLYLSLFINLGILVYFKYTNFFIANFTSFDSLAILVPIGISFYTFKSISYVLDVYFETIERPQGNYFHHLLYVSYFPNLIAGPITRAEEFFPQLGKKLELDRHIAGTALFLFVSGVFKKLFIADYLGLNLVDRVFDNPALYSGTEHLMAAFGFVVQLYYDFSGYTDMALGISMLLGINLSPNFNEPLKARNVSDFWRRWHISLSTWFNDYVFIPLSFNLRRWRKAGLVSAILITFLISGFWHGASWTFVLWGVFHGIAIAWDSLTVKWRSVWASKVPGYGYWSVFLTVVFLTLTIIFFKAPTVEAALTMTNGIFRGMSFSTLLKFIVEYRIPFLMLVFGTCLHYLPIRVKKLSVEKFINLHWALRAVSMAVCILVVYQVVQAGMVPFKYLEF